MINNDTLFDHFVGARRRGHRSAWSAPRNPVARQVYSRYVGSALVEPAERITETDVLDDSVMDNCGHCGEPDYAAMLGDGICSYCSHAALVDWEETQRAILREEYAMRGGPLVA